MKNFTKADIIRLKQDGKIRDYYDPEENKPKARKKRLPKLEKYSYEKEYIKNYLLAYCAHYDYELMYGENEKKVVEGRKFRFDYFIIELNHAIEYEGIISRKSRHTTLAGYSKDCEKYNIASAEGYKLTRYTALNYENIINDFKIN